MDFFKCSIAGTMYGTGITEIQRAAARRNGSLLEEVIRYKGNVNLKSSSTRGCHLLSKLQDTYL